MLTIKRTAIYIRVSTDEQARHGYSLDAQLADLRSHAQKKGYCVVDVYADEGASARKALSRRKEIQRLLKDVEAGNIDIIIFIKLDRWFRNIADYYKVQEILDKHHVLWECTQEDYNTTTSNGRLMLNLKLTIAQNESDMISDRIKFVLNDRIRRGEAVMSKCPIGYSKCNKKIVINEDAEIVRYMFDTYEQTQSKRLTLQKTNEKYSKKISYEIISFTLKHKIYIGVYHEIPNFCPAIISDEQFMRVQRLLGRNIKKTASGRVYLFSGLLVCPDCGRTLTAYYTYCQNKLKTKKYEKLCYRCNKHGVDKTACSYGGCVAERVLERYLITNLNTWIKQEYEKRVNTSAKKSRPTRINTTAINKKLERLKDLYVDGLIPKDVYLSDYNKLKTKLMEATQLNNPQNRISPQIRNLIGVTDLETLYTDMSRENKFTFWHTILQEIYITGSGYDRSFDVSFW